MATSQRIHDDTFNGGSHAYYLISADAADLTFTLEPGLYWTTEFASLLPHTEAAAKVQAYISEMSVDRFTINWTVPAGVSGLCLWRVCLSRSIKRA